MVKGITRQVILVKSPDPRLFEEAIFIVKEEAVNRAGVNAEQVIRQARQAANGYLRGGKRAKGDWTDALLWGVVGAGTASLLWCAGLFLL